MCRHPCWYVLKFRVIVSLLKLCFRVSLISPGRRGPRLIKNARRKANTSTPAFSLSAPSSLPSQTTLQRRRRKLTFTVIIRMTLTRHSSDHVPYRNSKLTRLLQPSLSGNARISVICTINPDPTAIGESTSTLLFAKRIKSVKVTYAFRCFVVTTTLTWGFTYSSTHKRRRS